MQEAIDELHFHPRWFETGFLPDAFFARQLAHFRSGEDEEGWQYLEHHRYYAFKTILASHDNLSSEQLEQYLALCHLDEDQSMADAALMELLEWHGLTSEQYVYLTQHEAFAFAAAQKIIWRNRMRASLLLDSSSMALLDEILEKQDPTFERELVETVSLSTEQLEVLAEKGISHAVRNIARNKLSGVNKNWS
jgi:hypothetical protein